MRKGNLLFSAVQFIFALLVVLLGLFFVGLQEAPYLRYRLSLFLSNPGVSFSGIGYLILTCGLFLLIGFCVMYKGRYYQIKMGKNQVTIDSELIHQLVSSYWRQLFPDQENGIKVQLMQGQKLHIMLDLFFVPQEEREGLLERIEKELGQRLGSDLGYNKEFVVSVFIK